MSDDSKTIRVDGEVWEALQAVAQPFVDQSPNDVLRRLLLGGTAGQPAPTRPSRRPGALMAALEDGSLRPGDALVCEQPRRKRTFRAEVTADGWIKTLSPAVGEFAKPSPALGACTGGAINGWGNWVHERTGRMLQEFRR